MTIAIGEQALADDVEARHKTQTDQTASRAIDGTVYTNTTGFSMLVAITYSGAGGGSSIEVKTDANANPVMVVGKASSAGLLSTITFEVLKGNKYKATDAGGGVKIAWIEWTL